MYMAQPSKCMYVRSVPAIARLEFAADLSQTPCCVEVDRGRNSLQSRLEICEHTRHSQPYPTNLSRTTHYTLERCSVVPHTGVKWASRMSQGHSFTGETSSSEQKNIAGGLQTYTIHTYVGRKPGRVSETIFFSVWSLRLSACKQCTRPISAAFGAENGSSTKRTHV